MMGNEKHIEGSKENEGIITPAYMIGCGSRTRRDCCITDEKCRMELKVLSNGVEIYTGHCCN